MNHRDMLPILFMLQKERSKLHSKYTLSEISSDQFVTRLKHYFQEPVIAYIMDMKVHITRWIS